MRWIYRKQASDCYEVGHFLLSNGEFRTCYICGSQEEAEKMVAFLNAG